MANVVDVLVTSQLLVDWEIYTFWVCGNTPHDAALSLQKLGIFKTFSANFNMLMSEVFNQYCMFSLLEKYLQNPPKLFEQCIYMISTVDCSKLISIYYDFDHHVIRDLLGKKMSARDRRDLEDIMEKRAVSLRSCRRQFDNLKRVFKTVEEMPGSLVNNIKKRFFLSDELARAYAAIVFITNQRFETTKKKLLYLTFDDFAYCANQMMKRWSCSSKECHSHVDQDQNFDASFLQELRELKVVIESKFVDEHKSLVMDRLARKISDRVYPDLDANFKSLSKALISIATGLNHAKEVRDFFVDLVEEIIEPCKGANWTSSDLQLFLNVYCTSAVDVSPFIGRPNLLNLWSRFMTPMINCIVKLYHV